MRVQFWIALGIFASFVLSETTNSPCAEDEGRFEVIHSETNTTGIKCVKRIHLDELTWVNFTIAQGMCPQGTNLMYVSSLEQLLYMTQDRGTERGTVRSTLCSIPGKIGAPLEQQFNKNPNDDIASYNFTTSIDYYLYNDDCDKEIPCCLAAYVVEEDASHHIVKVGMVYDERYVWTADVFCEYMIPPPSIPAGPAATSVFPTTVLPTTFSEPLMTLIPIVPTTSIPAETSVLPTTVSPTTFSEPMVTPIPIAPTTPMVPDYQDYSETVVSEISTSAEDVLESTTESSPVITDAQLDIKPTTTILPIGEDSSADYTEQIDDAPTTANQIDPDYQNTTVNIDASDISATFEPNENATASEDKKIGSDGDIFENANGVNKIDTLAPTTSNLQATTVSTHPSESMTTSHSASKASPSRKVTVPSPSTVRNLIAEALSSSPSMFTSCTFSMILLLSRFLN